MSGQESWPYDSRSRSHWVLISLTLDLIESKCQCSESFIVYWYRPSEDLLSIFPVMSGEESRPYDSSLNILECGSQWISNLMGSWSPSGCYIIKYCHCWNQGPLRMKISFDLRAKPKVVLYWAGKGWPFCCLVLYKSQEEQELRVMGWANTCLYPVTGACVFTPSIVSTERRLLVDFNSRTGLTSAWSQPCRW